MTKMTDIPETINRIWRERIRARGIRAEAERRLAGCPLERFAATRSSLKPRKAA